MTEFEEYIISLLVENDVNEILFSTWQVTDRSTLKKECLNVHDFVPELSHNLKKLIPHHFVSKKQSYFISNLKTSIKQNEGILEMDYSENYAYVVQNAPQQFHYNNNQCSIFSAILYYKKGTKVKHSNVTFLSECTTHDTTALYLAQTYLMQKKFPKIKKLYYV